MPPAQEPRPAYPAEVEILTSGRAGVSEQLMAAGHLLRRRGSTDANRRLVDAALRKAAAGEVAATLTGAPVDEVKRRLRRGAEEAFEVAFADTEEERDMWSAAASEALRSRDRLASLCAAASRWVELHDGAGDEVSAAVVELAGRLGSADRELRGSARSLTAINALRRRDLDELLPELRDEAWWYADRVEDDELLHALGGVAGAGSRESRSAAVSADLDASRLPPRAGLAEASRISAEVDAWIEEL